MPDRSCGHEWDDRRQPPERRGVNHTGKRRTHRCVKVTNHVTKNHRCECGAVS